MVGMDHTKLAYKKIMEKKAFTLIELMIVVVIVGILATLGIAYMVPAKESAIDNEARANLRLTIAAERSRRMESTQYYPSVNTVTATCTTGGVQGHICHINEELRLLLPLGANRNWDYQTWANNAAVPPTTCAQATRFNGPNVRTWRLRNTEADPVRASTCP
jgi:prepilin-type N-terminal cleavage/methylation domain-containing protein